MKKYTILIIFICNILYSQIDSSKNVFSTRDYGPFYLKSNKLNKINVKIEHVTLSKRLYPNFNESDISITINDSLGQTLYISNFPANGDGSTKINVKSKSLSQFGNVLIVYYSEIPCCPDCCTDAQIFGFNSLGKFIALTGFIKVMDDIENNQCLGELKWINDDLISDKPIFNSKDEVCYIEVLNYIGYGEMKSFDYYPIYKDGYFFNSDYQFKKIRKIPIIIGNANYYVIKGLISNDYDSPVITIYSKPDLLSSSKNLSPQNNMTIKFFEMYRIEKDNELNFWIHLRINGIEGYILISELEKLGLLSFG